MNLHILFKLIHILAVIVFLGNIFTGLFWMQRAHKTGNVSIINHTMKNIILSDMLFTVPGVLIIIAGGVGAAIELQLSLLRTGWIFWTIVAFSISGIFFGWKLVPLQKKIYKLTSPEHMAGNSFDWNEYKRAYKAWDLWGLLSLLTPLIALVLMILKRPV